MTALLEQLNNLWNQVIEVIGRFVLPDWGGLVGLLPVLILVFVIGPAVSLGILAWFLFFVRKPRARVQIEEGPRPAAAHPDGAPAYPAGLPYCARDRLVFPSGETRCSECRDELTVVCPMCGLGREAAIPTCGNCGLVLKVERRTRIMRPAGPPPGGAAAA